MPNGLHQLWSAVEKDDTFQQADQATRLQYFDRFIAGVRQQHGDTVFGLHGFERNVRERLTTGQSKLSFGESFTREREEDSFFTVLTTSLGDERELRTLLDAEYERRVEAGEPAQSFTGSLAGGLANYLTAAGAGAGVGATVGAVPGAVVGGVAAGVTKDATTEPARNTALNYFALLDDGVEPDEAFKKARNLGVAAGAAVTATNFIPGGGLTTAVGKKIAGKTAVGAAARKALLAGNKTTGATRVGVEALKGSVDDVVVEAGIAGGELAFGVDARDYKGTVGERAALAGVGGLALRGAIAGSLNVGRVAKNAVKGDRLTKNLFHEENIAGFMGSVDEQIYQAQQGLRNLEGDELDVARAKITDLEAAKETVRGIWHDITDGSEPVEFVQVDKRGRKGQDAEWQRKTKIIAAFTGIYEWEGDRIQRQTLLHEAAHAHFDTLPDDLQKVLFKLFEAEMTYKAGPLFTKDGEWRANLSEDLTKAKKQDTQFFEWYAERTALKNDAWSKGKLQPEAKASESFVAKLAADLRNKIYRVGRRLGFGDGLDNSFRDFLDAGEKYDFRPLPKRPSSTSAAPDPTDPLQEAPAEPVVPADPEPVAAPETPADPQGPTPLVTPPDPVASEYGFGGDTDAIRQNLRELSDAYDPAAEADTKTRELRVQAESLVRDLEERAARQTEAPAATPTPEPEPVPASKIIRPDTTVPPVAPLYRNGKDVRVGDISRLKVKGKQMAVRVRAITPDGVQVRVRNPIPGYQKYQELTLPNADDLALGKRGPAELKAPEIPDTFNKEGSLSGRPDLTPLPKTESSQPVKADRPTSTAPKEPESTPAPSSGPLQGPRNRASQVIAEFKDPEAPTPAEFEALRQAIELENREALERLRRQRGDHLDTLFSRRGKALDEDDEFTYRNGWLMPNGKFIDTVETAGVTIAGNGTFDELGNHARAALDWLDENDPDAVEVFWANKEVEAEINDTDLDVRDSDVYEFMQSRGWVRVVSGTGATYIEGRPTGRQRKLLKDSAITTGKVLMHDFGNGRDRILYSPDNIFSRRSGGGPSPVVAAPVPTRRFAERAGDKFADLDAVNKRRPDVYSREEDIQDISSIKADAGAKSDAELDNSVEVLRSTIKEGEKNVAVLDAMERLRRAQEAGDSKKVEEVFEVMAKAGTTIAQMLRQYREFKGATKTKNMVELIDRALQQDGRRLTTSQRERLQALADADEKAKQELDDAIAKVENSPGDRKLVKEAFKLQHAENQAFRKFVNQARSLMPRKLRQLPADLLAIIQGNLLTPVSTGRNANGNYISLIPRTAARVPAALVDRVRVAVFGGKRTIALPSIREAAWFVKGSLRGLRTAKDALLIGSSDDNVVGETIRGFNPVSALVKAFSPEGLPVDVKSGKVRVSDRLGKLFEGTFGMAPEAMLRSLSALDELAKEGFRAARAAEETKLKDLEADSLEFTKAELGLDEGIAKASDQTALQFTYQDSSTAANIVQSIDNAAAAVPVIGPALRFGLRVGMSPYIRTPANLLVEGMKFAMPAFGMAHGAVKAMQGNAREAQLSFAYATTGAIIGTVASSLVGEDLISGGPDDDRGKNLVRSESGMGYFRINLSGFHRWLDGADASYRPGDRTVRLDSLGVVGYVFAAKAEAARIQEKDPTRVPPEWVNSVGLDQLSNTMAMGRFAVNQTMLQGVDSFLKAMERGTYERWVADKVNLLTSVGMPNTIMSWRQTQEDAAKPNLLVPGDSLATAANVIEYKFGDRGPLLQKRGIFGEVLKATPDGAHPEVFHMLDFLKVEKVGDDAINAVYDLYRKTGDDGVIPSVVSDAVNYKGQRVRLTPELYDSLYADAQKAKGEAFVRFFKSPQWQGALRQAPAVAVERLKKSYSQAGTLATKRWTFQHRKELEELSSGLADYLQSQK